MIKKAVLPAAGLGIRMLSATKEQPKEMLPVFSRTANGTLALKPLLQLVFEQLFTFGIDEFCFIVGREKRAIEDHFTPDFDYLNNLSLKGKSQHADALSSFYEMIDRSTIVWMNQNRPLGFGDAVSRAKPFVKDEPFLVHAGDTYVISKGNSHLRRLLEHYEGEKADAMLTLHEVEDPRQFGVAVVEQVDSAFRVKEVVEKPDHPKTKFAIAPIYAFKPSIFQALESVGPGKGGEIQLTDGIQELIRGGRKVGAVMLEKADLRLDIGTPENYWDAQRLSHGLLADADIES